MNYLFLMFLKYYRGGKYDKHNAYFSALSMVVICIYFFVLSGISFLKIKFTIRGMGESKLQDYLIMGFIIFPIYILVYYVYPSKKMIPLYKHFKNDKIKNIIIIIILMLISIPYNSPYRE